MHYVLAFYDITAKNIKGRQPSIENTKIKYINHIFKGTRVISN